jgi:hypothetical protein
MSNASALQDLYRDLKLRLGGQMVSLEMDIEHLELAGRLAFDKFRQHSSNSVEESYAFLDLQTDQDVYYLPETVQEVRQIFRRGTGASGPGGGVQMDPFNLAFNNLYLLQAGRSGGLLTYELFSQYQKTVGMMFGMYVNFTWSSTSKRLQLIRKPGAPETVLLWIYNHRPEEVLLQDAYAKNWIRDWALAELKEMLGQARSKFQQIAGPSGGTTLNGSELKQEAQQMKEALMKSIQTYEEGSIGLGFIIG